MKRVKRNYSNEFKQETVRLSYQRDNIKELAIELGIDVARIYKWRTSGRSNTTDLISIKKDNEEIKRLKRALKDSQLELEILKKELSQKLKTWMIQQGDGGVSTEMEALSRQKKGYKWTSYKQILKERN